MAPEKHSLSPSLLQGPVKALSSLERAGSGRRAQGHPRGFFLRSHRTTAVPGAPVARPLQFARGMMSSERVGPCRWMASDHALEVGRPGVRMGRDGRIPSCS